MCNINSENLARWGTFAGGVATAIAVIFLVQQVQLMREDSDYNNRPWIGGVNFTESHNVVFYNYQNFGKIPNTGGTITFLVSTNLITRDMLTGQGTKTTSLQIVMPSEKLTSIFNGKIEEGIQSAKDGKSELYLGVTFTYEYGNGKVGDYNVITHYDPRSHSFIMLDSWVK